MAQNLRYSFTEADKAKVSQAYTVLMDRGPNYIEEIRSVDLSCEETLWRLAEMHNLVAEISAETAKAFRPSHVLSREEKQAIRGLFAQVAAIMDEKGFTLEEVIDARPPYTDLAGRQTALPVFRGPNRS